MTRPARKRSVRHDTALMSVRSTLILTLAVLAGTAAGTLTVVAGHPPAEAILAGGAVLAAGTRFFHWLID